MSAQDPVGAAREALTALASTVLRVRNEYGDTLGVRRLTADVDRLAESLDNLGDPAPGHRPSVDPDEMVLIPDDPYDETSGTGLGRRLLFQRVPEPKTVKNRLHIDVHTGPGERDAEAERLVALGARILHAVDEPGGSWLVLADPEGNEFCVN